MMPAAAAELLKPKAMDILIDIQAGIWGLVVDSCSECNSHLGSLHRKGSNEVIISVGAVAMPRRRPRRPIVLPTRSLLDTSSTTTSNTWLLLHFIVPRSSSPPPPSSSSSIKDRVKTSCAFIISQKTASHWLII